MMQYISSFLKSKEKNIFEQEYKWIDVFIQELGFSNISYVNNGLNQVFIHQNKNQRLLLSIQLSPRRRAWDVISIQLISNKSDTIDLAKKWSIWRSSLHNEELKKEIRNVSEAFFSVDVGYGDKEPLLLYNRLKLEDIYIVPPHAILVCSPKIEDLIIKAFNLRCLRLSNRRQLKRENGLWDGIDKNGCPTGGIMWEYEFVGCAYTE